MQHLAHYLARQSGFPAHGDALAALLAALQQAHDNGDTLIRLNDEQQRAADTLAATPLLADDDRAAPLTRRGDRLWISRNYQQEARLAAYIRARLDGGDALGRIDNFNPPPLQSGGGSGRGCEKSRSDDVHNELPTALAPAAAANVPGDNLRAEQQQAVRLARSQRLALINGGPGTGKTYTIARLIAAERAAAPDIRIALAAPTGKAAKRMEESIATAEVRGLPAQTLHRLLGIGADGKARYHKSRQLPYDIIIIDEASMLSLELAHALLAATAPATRLILLGDADQLAAVEPGAILHDLSQHPALQQQRVTLKESTRFSADSGIGKLAAILSGEGAQHGERLLAALRQKQLPPPVGEGRGGARLQTADAETGAPIHWYPSPDADLYRALIAPYRHYLDALQTADATPQQLLALYDQYRILCAGHHGALGTRRINAALRQIHQREQGENPARPHYRGLPLMVLANDYRLQLYNGDIGICLGNDDALQLHLPGHEPVPLDRLNPANLADAYALSIHKSQGSEYPRVALALDDRAERLLSRELLYTGITRSKGALDIYASEAALRAAASTPTRRNTGLAWHLNPADG